MKKHFPTSTSQTIMDRRGFMKTLGVLGLGDVVAGTAAAEIVATPDGSPNLKFAVVQVDTIACEVNFNVHKLMIWTRRAFENGANYVFLHEGATADYTPDPIKFGRPLDSAEVYGFIKLCKRYKGFVALGLNEVFENKPYISMVWLGPEGVIGVYRKTFLWPNASQMSDAAFEEYRANYVGYREGFRLERTILACGAGPTVLQVGSYRIGCLICADGAHPNAWKTFEKDKPDLIFWQNNRGNVANGVPNQHAKELRVPIVASNRCGFSYGAFQPGGSCIVADSGTTVCQANNDGEEEIIYCNYRALIHSAAFFPTLTAPRLQRYAFALRCDRQRLEQKLTRSRSCCPRASELRSLADTRA